MATFSDDQIAEILRSSPKVAVLGIHTEPAKPAHYVPAYLHEHGYTIFGVNPRLVGEQLYDQPVRATLAELTTPIDIVDVFRRGDAIADHLADIFAMAPPPKVVWFQLGIRNDVVAAQLEAKGVTVVQDKCTLAEHRRLHVGRPHI
jgi:uncharacterized protein